MRPAELSLETAKLEQIDVLKQMDHIVDAIANGFKHETMLKKFTSLEQAKAMVDARIKEIAEKQQQKLSQKLIWKQLVIAAKSQLMWLSGPELKDFIKAYVKRIVAYQEK